MKKPIEQRLPVTSQQRTLVATAEQEVRGAQERLQLVLSTLLAGAPGVRSGGQVLRLERTEKQWWLVYVVSNGASPAGDKEP